MLAIVTHQNPVDLLYKNFWEKKKTLLDPSVFLLALADVDLLMELGASIRAAERRALL